MKNVKTMNLIAAMMIVIVDVAMIMKIMNVVEIIHVDVDIAMLVDYKALYMVGQGRLTHDKTGFRLTGCDGKLDYAQPPLASYSLNADYLWYEIGDVICVGDRNTLYYCFPKGADVVAKTRLAAEELYKMKKARKGAKAE